MPLPRMLRRLLWVWGCIGGLLLGLLFVGIFAPTTFAPGVPVGSGSTVLLTRPDGTSVRLKVDLADAPDEWRLGLMNRPVIERGMLFVFPDEEPQSFWMKDTLVPLDIVYFRTDGSWVSSARMEPCRHDPCASYPSAGPVRYALELPADSLDPGVGEGWKLTVKD